MKKNGIVNIIQKKYEKKLLRQFYLFIDFKLNDYHVQLRVL